jgi:hypothetical protein
LQEEIRGQRAGINKKPRYCYLSRLFLFIKCTRSRDRMLTLAVSILTSAKAERQDRHYCTRSRDWMLTLAVSILTSAKAERQDRHFCTRSRDRMLTLAVSILTSAKAERQDRHFCTRSRDRTGTALLPLVFETSASTNSAIRAKNEALPSGR